MTIEIQMTKEIGNYEPKFVGPLTIRQTIVVAVAAPLLYLMYTSLSDVLPQEIIGFFCLIPAVVGYGFGWWRPYGMKGEEFVQSIFVNILLAPSKRKYKVVNYFDKTDEEVFQAEKGEDDSDEALDEKIKLSEKTKQEKKRKKKYKLSSMAVK